MSNKKWSHFCLMSPKLSYSCNVSENWVAVLSLSDYHSALEAGTENNNLD